jgi:ribosome-binding protein aMBF1 (putative translation factor)
VFEESHGGIVDPGQTTETLPLTPQQVQAAREALGWTTYQLAARCGFGQHVVACFEASGKITASRALSEGSRRNRLQTIRIVFEAEGLDFTNDHS